MMTTLARISLMIWSRLISDKFKLVTDLLIKIDFFQSSGVSPTAPFNVNSDDDDFVNFVVPSDGNQAFPNLLQVINR